MSLLQPILVLGVMGIVFAFLLYFASTVFYVEVDPKVQEVSEALPGVNCGACGYPGCDGLANAIAAGQAPVTACPVGGEAVAEKLAAIMGQDASGMEKMIAVVKCQGDRSRAVDKYEFAGHGDCRAIAMNSGGNKLCPTGCLGGGSCLNVCDFGAIKIVNGLAIIDKDKCTGCKKCIDTCPKAIIEMMPYDRESVVLCSSHDKGKAVRSYCKVGCIGCTICAKQYPEGFEIDNFLAHATYDPHNYDSEALENAVAKCPNSCISPKDHREEILTGKGQEELTV